MSDHASLILAIIGSVLTYTVSIIALVNWLNGKFREVEKLIYRETQKHRRENDDELEDHAIRIQRLELKAFGFTNSGQATDIRRHREVRPTNTAD